MAWWVPLLRFLLASWKEPPAHSAEAAETAKTQSLKLANTQLFLVTFISGCPAWRYLVIRSEGLGACPPWEHCGLKA